MGPIRNTTKVVASVGSVKEIARLRYSERFTKIADAIHSRRRVPRSRGVAPRYSDAEFELVKESNRTLAEIDDEMLRIHRFARKLYSKRFPELEVLLPEPTDYLLAVKAIGDDLCRGSHPSNLERVAHLKEFRSPATMLAVSVAASTTRGEALIPQELEAVLEACTLAQELNRTRSEISEFIESRMSVVAPKLKRWAGAFLAVKLIEAAGGLSKLARMPPGEIERLGAPEKTSACSSVETSAGSSMETTPGSLISCAESVLNYPLHLRSEAAKQLAIKCSRASRADSSAAARDVSELASLTGKLAL